MKRVLILGGTAEAVDLAQRIRSFPGFEVMYSLAGRTRAPNLPDGPVRRGGFGGADGLAESLAGDRIGILIDATHPFAARMAANAKCAADKAGVPRFKFLRPPWQEPEGARWLRVPSARDAAAALEERFTRVFLSTGLNDAPAFAHLSDIWFLVRTIEPPATPIPFPDFEHLRARGPFSPEAEKELFRHHGIQAVVTKNSGGTATFAKLQAAHELAIPVVMIDRPAPPAGGWYEEPELLIDAIRTIG